MHQVNILYLRFAQCSSGKAKLTVNVKENYCCKLNCNDNNSYEIPWKNSVWNSKYKLKSTSSRAFHLLPKFQFDFKFPVVSVWSDVHCFYYWRRVIRFCLRLGIWIWLRNSKTSRLTCRNSNSYSDNSISCNTLLSLQPSSREERKLLSALGHGLQSWGKGIECQSYLSGNLISKIMRKISPINHKHAGTQWNIILYTSNNRPWK